MKRIAIFLAATLALAACGGGGASQATASPARTTATPTPTPQTKLTFTATLVSEGATLAGGESSCTGSATIMLDTAANNGSFEVELKGCPATAEPTIMHIHKGAKGVAGPVSVNSGLAAGEWKLTAGAGKITKNVATIDAALISEIIASPAGFYVNVHSKANPAGFSRGQLEKKS